MDRHIQAQSWTEHRFKDSLGDPIPERDKLQQQQTAAAAAGRPQGVSMCLSRALRVFVELGTAAALNVCVPRCLPVSSLLSLLLLQQEQHQQRRQQRPGLV